MTCATVPPSPSWRSAPRRRARRRGTGRPCPCPRCPRSACGPHLGGVDVALQNHPVGALRGTARVDGAEVGTVGLAPVGDLRSPQRLTDAVHVAGGVGGGEVLQFAADTCALRRRRPWPEPRCSADRAIRRGIGEQAGHRGVGQLAAHRGAVLDAARIEPDQVVLVQHRGGQLRRHRAGHVQAVQRRAARVQQEYTAPLAGLGGGDPRDRDGDGSCRPGFW